MGYEFFIARRYLRAKRHRHFVSAITLISVLGVVVGTAALIVVLSMMNGFEKEIRTRIVGITGHVTIFDQHNEGVAEYQDLGKRVQALPQVVATAPFVYAKAAIASENENDGILVRGVDAEAEKKVTTIGDEMVAGTFDLAEQPGRLSRIILGRGLAERLGVRTGDTVALFSLRGQSLSAGLTQPKVAKFSVGGLFETGMYEYDASLAYINLTRAQSLFEMDGKVTGLQVKTDDLFGAQKVARALENVLGTAYYAQDWMAMHKNLFSWMALEKYAMFVALSLIIAVAAFNIVSSLIMVVLEKRREIGVLKAMGAKREGIKKIFVLMGLITSSVGLVAGFGLGLLLCWLQQTFKIISLPAEIYFINTLPIDVRPGDFLIVAVAALGISFLATLYPSRRAAALVPAEAIRYQ